MLPQFLSLQNTMDVNYQLLIAQKALQRHITLLSINAKLLNAHCYNIDDTTNSSRANIEREYNDIITAINDKKCKLLAELDEIHAAKVEDARIEFVNLSQEIQLCEDLFSQITQCIDDRDNQRCDRGDLCQQVTKTISNSPFTEEQNRYSAQLKSSFAPSTKSKIIKLIESFGQLFSTESISKSNIDDYDYHELKDQEKEVLDLKNETETALKLITSKNWFQNRCKRQQHIVSARAEQWRQRQIDIAKQTLEYKQLLEMYPNYESAKWRKENPQFFEMPKINEKIGKKRWSGKMKKYRAFLHGFAANKNQIDDQH